MASKPPMIYIDIGVSAAESCDVGGCKKIPNCMIDKNIASKQHVNHMCIMFYLLPRFASCILKLSHSWPLA